MDLMINATRMFPISETLENLLVNLDSVEDEFCQIPNIINKIAIAKAICKHTEIILHGIIWKDSSLRDILVKDLNELMIQNDGN